MTARKSKICMENLPFNLTLMFKSGLAFIGSELWYDLQLRGIGRSAYFTLVLVSVKRKIHHCFESIPLSEIRINHRPRRAPRTCQSQTITSWQRKSVKLLRLSILRQQLVAADLRWMITSVRNGYIQAIQLRYQQSSARTCRSMYSIQSLILL